MATDLERLVVQLSADMKGFDKAMNRAIGVTERRTRAIENRFAKMNKNISTSFASSLRAGVAGIGAALSVREVASYADAWTEAGNKIAASAQSAGVQTRSLSELNKGAIEARVALSDYADLYARMIRSASGVAKNETEIATATNLVAKAFKAGGASAQEQAAGILQLGQALGSGVLQGDELRSLRENAPVVAQAIADEFKTTIAGLKQLGADGKLTSDRVFQAILSAQTKIEAQFAKTNPTISDSFTRLKNALTEYVGLADSSNGASSQFATVMSSLADNIGTVADAVLILSGALIAMYAGKGIGAATAATVAFINASIAERAAMVETARTAQAAAVATQASAVANLKYAQSAYAAAQSGSALGLSMARASKDMVAAQTAMSGANARVISTTAAMNTAIASTGLVARTTAGAVGVLNGALALVGGPASVALLAAYALYTFADANSEAESAAKLHRASVEILSHEIEVLDYANSTAVASTKAKIESDIEAAKVALQRAKAERELAASIMQEEINPSMSLLPAPSAMDAANTVSQSPIVKEKQALIDELDRQLGELNSLNVKFGDYASGKERPGLYSSGYGKGSASAADSAKTKSPKAVKQTADSRFDADIQSVRDRTAALIQEQQILGLTFIEQEKRRMSLDLEQQALADVREEARKKGVVDWQNMQISAEQRAKISLVSEEYAKQADVLRELEVAQQSAESSAQDFYNTAKTSFVDVISGTKKLGDALLDIGKKFADLALNSAFDSMFGGAAASSSGGWLTSAFKFLGFADGGHVQSFASGGNVRGTGTGRSDSIPAMLSNGEFVVNAKATKQHRALLEQINGGAMPAFADGGAVSSMRAPSLPTIPRLSKATVPTSVTIPINIDATGADAAGLARVEQRLAKLQQTLPGTIVSTIKNAEGRRGL